MAKPTADQIVAIPITGNHSGDSRIFDIADAYVNDPDNSYADRARVLKWLVSDVMGMEPNYDKYGSDEAFVESCINA